MRYVNLTAAFRHVHTAAIVVAGYAGLVYKNDYKQLIAEAFKTFLTLFLYM